MFDLMSKLYWLNILLLSSDNDSDSNISINLFHTLTQILVMEFKLYFTLFKHGQTNGHKGG